jgi:hypothetical protein
MATIGITPGQNQQPQTEAQPSGWLRHFTASERDELLHDDMVAGRSITVILVVIFLIGLLLSGAAILMW